MSDSTPRQRERTTDRPHRCHAEAVLAGVQLPPA